MMARHPHAVEDGSQFLVQTDRVLVIGGPIRPVGRCPRQRRSPDAQVGAVPPAFAAGNTVGNLSMMLWAASSTHSTLAKPACGLN
jgi:hypothetical protein